MLLDGLVLSHARDLRCFSGGSVTPRILAGGRRFAWWSSTHECIQLLHCDGEVKSRIITKAVRDNAYKLSVPVQQGPARASVADWGLRLKYRRHELLPPSVPRLMRHRSPQKLL